MRKAPGTDVFDFGQTLLLDCPPRVAGQMAGEAAGVAGGAAGTRAVSDEGVVATVARAAARAEGVSCEEMERRTHEDHGDGDGDGDAVLAAFPAEVRTVYRAAQRRPNHNALVQQSFETPLLPVGGVLQVVIQVGGPL